MNYGTIMAAPPFAEMRNNPRSQAESKSSKSRAPMEQWGSGLDQLPTSMFFEFGFSLMVSVCLFFNKRYQSIGIVELFSVSRELGFVFVLVVLFVFL